MVSAWKRWTCAAASAAGMLLAGCAAVPPLPAGLDLQQAVIVPLGVEPDVQLQEAGWKSRSARTGGLVGAGLGFGLGGLACLGTGFLAPLCLGTVVPLSTAVGAVGGAVAGAASSHHGPEVEEKSAWLQREWLALAARAPLAESLQRQQAQPAHLAPTVTPPAWRLQVGYATLGTVGGGTDQAFLLQATARLVVWRADEARAATERSYLAQSAERQTRAQWGADGGAVLRSTLDGLAATLTRQIAADLGLPAP